MRSLFARMTEVGSVLSANIRNYSVAFLCVVAGISIVWYVGDIHRNRCVNHGRVSCSVLPWDNGKEREVKEGYDWQSWRSQHTPDLSNQNVPDFSK